MKKIILLVTLLLTGITTNAQKDDGNRMVIHHNNGQTTVYACNRVDSINFVKVENTAAQVTIKKVTANDITLNVNIPEACTKCDFAYATKSNATSINDIYSYVEKNKVTELSHSGDVTINNLMPNTDYIIYAVTKDIYNVSGSIVTTEFTTETVQTDGPKIYISGQPGDETGNNKDSYILFSLQCESKDASYAELLISDKKQLDNILGNGYTLEEVAIANEGNGIILNEEELKKLNTSSYTITLNNSDGILPDTEYTCIALVRNESNGTTVVRADTKTDSTTEDTTPPTVEVTGMAGDADGNNKSSVVTFVASCTSKNASYAEAFVTDTDFIESILGDMTLEQLMELNAGIGKILELSDLEKLNNSSITLSWNEMKSGTQYTLLLCVKNKGGGIVVKRCDISTETEALYNNQGKLTLRNIRTHKNNVKIHNIR